MTDQPQSCSSQRHSARVSALCFIGLFLLGFAARIHDVAAKPFWMDEVTTIHRARLPLWQMIQNSVFFHQFPSYFILTSWALHFGHDELWVRMPAILFGALSCALAFGVARALGGTLAGLTAGLLMVFSPAQVQYGQEARSYTLLICTILIALWGLVLLAQDPEGAARRLRAPGGRPGAWAAYVVGTIAALNVLGDSMFWFVAANLAAFAIAWRRVGRARAFLAQLAAGPVADPPVLPALVPGAEIFRPARRDGRAGLGAAAERRAHLVDAGRNLFHACDEPDRGAGVRRRHSGAGRAGAAAGRRRGLRAAPAACGPGGDRRGDPRAAAQPAGDLHHQPGLDAALYAVECGTFFICAGLGITLVPRRLQAPAVAVHRPARRANLRPYYHDETKPRWDLAAADLHADLQPGDLLLVDDPGAVHMMNLYLRRQGAHLPKTAWTRNVQQAAAALAAGHRVWAIQGRVGQADHENQEQFLAQHRLARPAQRASRIGLDIVLLRFNGLTHEASN